MKTFVVKQGNKCFIPMSSNFQPYVPVSVKTVSKSFRDTNILNLSNDGKI